MKTLPEHPSVDHVRQQAKDLLAHRRATQPAATLAEAQSALAHEYGFTTWADLKAEVERLRARAAPAEPALAGQVAEAFDLGTVTGEMVPLDRTWAEIWSLPTDRGTWVAARLFERTRVWDNVLEDEVRLVEAARSAGIVAPRPVRARDGAVLANVGGGRWRVHQAVKVGPPPVTATAELAEVAGHALGVLHRLALPTDRSITAPQEAPIQERWLSTQPTEHAWRAMARRAHDLGVAWADTLEAAIPALLDAASLCRDLTGEGVILSKHRLVPGDVRRGPDGAWVVLNWDHPSPMPPQQELGASLADCGTDDPTVLRAYLNGYRSAGLTPPQLDLGMFTTDISAVLNWTATRINIVLCGTDDEQRTLASRAVPGLLANPPTRARYERILEAVG